MLELLNKFGAVGIFVFVSSSMLAIGVEYTLEQIVLPLRNPRLLLLTLSANFVILPLGSVAIATGLRLEEPLANGLVLLGAVSGAPFVPKLTEYAQGNLKFAVGAMVLLTVGTIAYVPFILPLIRADVMVKPLMVARPLLLFVLLPLAVGLAIRAWSEVVATRLKPMLDRISNGSLFPIVLLVSALNISNILYILGTGGILAGMLLLFLGLVVGWLLGGPAASTRRALALSTGLRNFAVAIVVANQSFEDQKVEVMVIVTAVIALLIVVPLVRVWGLLPAAN
jgi:bile acid:Na+ symporter, BASS family